MTPTNPSISQVAIVSDWLPRLQIYEHRPAEGVQTFEIVLETQTDCDLWAFEEAMHASLHATWRELQTEIRDPLEHRLMLRVSLPRGTRGAADILRLAADIIEFAARQQVR